MVTTASDNTAKVLKQVPREVTKELTHAAAVGVAAAVGTLIMRKLVGKRFV